MEKNFFADYTRKYSLSKTLRFELIPEGRTQEYIEKNGILTEDENRAESYKRVKKIMDKYHKKFISESLKNLELKSLSLYDELYSKKDKSDNEKKDLKKVEADLRKQVIKCIKDNKIFEKLFKKEVITEELHKVSEGPDDLEAINDFKNFTTYFHGFFENRRNMYADEEKSTSVAYRIVNQNLPRYIDNIRIFKILMDTEICCVIPEMQRTYGEKLSTKRIEDFFSIDNYAKVVTNEEINLYNTIIGGFTTATNKKIKGLNEYINLYNQKNAKNKSMRKLPKLKPLYKQILADKETLSFIEEKFENDQEVIDTINIIINEIKNDILNSKSENSLINLMKNINEYDINKIYISNGVAITDLSNEIFSDWVVIKKCIEQDYDKNNFSIDKKKNEEYIKKRNNAIKKIDSFSIGWLNGIVEEYTKKNPHIETYYLNMAEKDGINLIDIFNKAYDKAEGLLNKDYYNKYGLCGDKKSVAIIKELLDSVKKIESFLKPLLGKGTESDKDDNFYGELDNIYKIISKIIPLYNKVRNYVTKKPYSTEKIKLNFQNPTLLKGWSLGVEKSKGGLIFREDNKYYLGIIVKGNSKNFNEYPVPNDNNDVIEKMEYLEMGNPNNNIQNLMVIDGITVKKNGRKEKEGEYSGENLQLEKLKNEYLPQEINKIRLNKTYLKGSDNFRKEDLEKFIDYYKQRVIDYYKDYKFNLKDAGDYTDFNDFADDIGKQAYQINMKKISKSYIYRLVEEGKLYLFKIYSKDFSEFSKGIPNLHTIYWKLLFDRRNLIEGVYKLLGNAEVFFRKASIEKENIVVHPKNQPVEKKHLISREKKETSIFEYDLIKDRRYTVDKYQFHVPITMNFCAEGKSKINDDVLNTIRSNLDIHVIGIDRGERNLLYVSVINPQGKIVYQESLNVIDNTRGYAQDYHVLLDEREKNLDKARKNWMEIETIKELKEGYLSQAIHKITDLMIEYNAIIVLEDLNFGFINGRKKVGKQVYQKFEKMLIDKLNYLVDKKKNCEEMGGALNAYQLTNKFESFSKLEKQSGFLFYVPAWNTSKIDPTTGFVNLLYPKYTCVEEAKKFIKKFDCIRYNNQKQYYEFEFDYNKFTEKADGTKTKWTICSFGSRVINYSKEKNNGWDSKEIDITRKITMLLNQYNINIISENLAEEICKRNEKELFSEFLNCIKLVLQIRNSKTGTAIDYMISPVMNEKGEFFDSRNAAEYLPQDADANGAYNIARKGLWVMEKIRETNDNKVNLAITNKEWLNYAQKNIII